MRLTFSPDGKYLAIGVPQKQVLHELASGREWSVASRAFGNDAPRFSSDGRLLFPVGAASSARLAATYVIQSMDPRVARDQGHYCYDLTTLPPKGLELESGAPIVAPDGSRYAAVPSPGGLWGSSTVSLHGLPSSRETGHIEMAGLIGAGFSPDGRWLALLLGRNPVTPPGWETRYDLELRLLDPTSARVRVTLPSPGQTWGTSGWKFSPDGKYLAVNYRTQIDDDRPGDPNPSHIMKLDIWEIPTR
jgi:WD40 repeat protein